MTPEIADSLGLKRPAGALVASVTPSSPAARAGLKTSDLIIAIDGQAVDDPNAFDYRFATKAIGGSARLGVVRAGKEMALSVALEAAPDTPHDELVIDSPSPFQGAKVSNLSPALADDLRLDPSTQGVVIVDIANGSPAQSLGFQRGDLVLSVNNAKIAKTARPRSASPASRAGAGASPSCAAASRCPWSCGDDAAARQARGPSLFAAAGLERDAPRPLADKLRPTQLGEVVGQDHLLGPDGALTRLLDTRTLGSLVFWGPPGTGKTTVARLLAQATDLHFEQISAIFSGVADLKKVFDAARARRETGQGTLLFVDEIHRFNRAQQDSFLPVMEDGTIVLVGATTENPSFELIAPLLSRARVLVFKPLDAEAIEKLLARAEAIEGKTLPLDAEARAIAHPHGRRRRPRGAHAGRRGLAGGAHGRDLRRGEIAGGGAAPRADLRQEAGRPLQPDQRPAQIGARLRSRRRALLSLPHARRRRGPALHRAPRGAHGGRGYRARRPAGAGRSATRPRTPTTFSARPKANWRSREAVIYVATAPKSNAAYAAYGAAMRTAKEAGSLLPPKHILNAPTKLMQTEGYGEGYDYDHDAPEAFSGQDYFPEALGRQTFYDPPERGFEREIRKRLDYWAKLRKERSRP